MSFVQLQLHFRAKHIFMSNKDNIIHDIIPGLKYRPNRVQSMMRATKSALDTQHKRTICFAELGRYSGQSASVAFDKMHRPDQPQVEALLSWLERLPITIRNQIINSACRCFPTLEDPRISHDPTQLSELKALLRLTSGMTIIQGANAGHRTFLITAIAHSYEIHRQKPDSVCGIDSHEPDWFVPLSNVVYLKNNLAW